MKDVRGKAREDTLVIILRCLSWKLSSDRSQGLSCYPDAGWWRDVLTDFNEVSDFCIIFSESSPTCQKSITAEKPAVLEFKKFAAKKLKFILNVVFLCCQNFF